MCGVGAKALCTGVDVYLCDKHMTVCIDACGVVCRDLLVLNCVVGCGMVYLCECVSAMCVLGDLCCGVSVVDETQQWVCSMLFLLEHPSLLLTLIWVWERLS